MADDDAHFRLRLPRETKIAIEERAISNKRTINAEVVARLEITLKAETASGNCSVPDALVRHNQIVERAMGKIPRATAPMMYLDPASLDASMSRSAEMMAEVAAEKVLARLGVAVDNSSVEMNWSDLESMLEKVVRKVLSERSDERPERRATVTVTARREHAKA